MTWGGAGKERKGEGEGGGEGRDQDLGESCPTALPRQASLRSAPNVTVGTEDGRLETRAGVGSNLIEGTRMGPVPPHELCVT